MPFHYDKDSDGIVTLTMDMSGSANVMNDEYRDLMGTAVSKLESDEITGVIITSAKKTFFAGGDLNVLIAITPENASQALEGVEELKSQLRRLEVADSLRVVSWKGDAQCQGEKWRVLLDLRFDSRVLILTAQRIARRS